MTPAAERPAEETAEPPAAPAAQAPTVVWVYDGPVCVSIIDAPAPAVHDGVCHCAACHGATRADWDGY